jgi:hypothetical protein
VFAVAIWWQNVYLFILSTHLISTSVTTTGATKKLSFLCNKLARKSIFGANLIDTIAR